MKYLAKKLAGFVMTMLVVSFLVFAAFAVTGKVSPRRDEGIPPYRTVNDGFIIMLQISPAATSPDSMHWARAVS